MKRLTEHKGRIFIETDNPESVRCLACNKKISSGWVGLHPGVVTAVVCKKCNHDHPFILHEEQYTKSLGQYYQYEASNFNVKEIQVKEEGTILSKLLLLATMR